jgi:hypothetical protein
MKKLLLSAIILIAVSFAGYSQTTFYPSGNPYAPTWEYSDVVSDDDGYYTNNKYSKAGNAIDDAALKYPSFNNGDAYDGAFEFFINTGDSVYTESGLNFTPEAVDTSGTTISLAEQLIDGLYVSKSYYFSPTQPVVRATFKIRNPTASAKSTKVGIFTNFGSDDDTQMDTSSTNGNIITNADRWMVTWDGSTSGDPINTMVRFGPGAVASPPIFGKTPTEVINNYQGADDFLDTFAISVPANSYALILQFNRLDTSTAAARANVAAFNTIASIQAAGFLTGLSNADLDKVVNWNFSTIDAIQGVTDVSNNVTVYPVPTNQNITIGLGDSFVGKTTINIKDMSGVSLLNKSTSKGSGTSYETIDVSALESGMYIVEIKNDEKVAYKKLIKN